MAAKALPPSNYVAPVQAKVQHYDQGIDYQGTPGDNVVAIGRAMVNAVKDDPGGFGKVVYYTLLDGPAKGRQIYVGHAQPLVHAGETVEVGSPVASLLQHGLGNASGLAGWTEIGFAKDGAPQPNSSQAFQAFVAPLKAAAPGTVDSAPASPLSAPSAGSAGAAAPSPGQVAAPDQFTAPLPLEQGFAQPQALDPGTVPASAANPQQYAETWQRIAADPWAPAGTQNYVATQGG